MRLCIGFLLILTLTLAASPQSARQDDQKVVLRASEVVLDVVVRDKKGRAIKDLTESDFEVYEDGVRQKIESFRLVLREAIASPAATGPAKEAPAPATPAPKSPAPEGYSLIALVFDRLSPNARNLAHQAALSYLNESVSPDDFVGVFGIDLSLRVLQPYTNNAQLVRQGIDRAGALAASSFSSSTEQARSLSDRNTILENQASSAISAAGAAGAAGNSGAAGGAAAAAGAVAEQMLNQMTLRSLEAFEALERDQQGYATTNGLQAVVNSLGRLPGRKAIIFFSEGLAIPPAVQAHFRAVINAANRANVSVYPLDAAGLRLESTNAESAREIQALGNRQLARAGRGRDDPSDGPLTRSLERNEDLLRLNPHSGLGQLADETGGFLIRETNDLSAGLRRIDEDLRAHYVLTYAPKNQEYDGKFRQIAVKLNRPNLDAQARKGYYAIQPLGSLPTLAHEMPALAVLSGGRAANDFPARAVGLSFPEPARPGLVAVLVEVPASAFSYTENKEKKSYDTNFSVVALIKDQSQQAVAKLSQNYLLAIPADKLEAAKKNDVLFYREAQLPPGRYAIETAVYDAPTGKASARKSNIEVQAADQGKLRLSSVAILKRAEQLAPQDRKADNPFHFGELLIYPNTGEPVRKAVSKQLAYYFTAYPAKDAKGAPRLALEILQQGKALGQATSDLPAPDAAGRIQYASAIPLESFPPGVYELRITVRDGQSSVTRSASFTLEP